MINSIEDIISAILCDCFAFFGVEKPVIPDYRIVEDIASDYVVLRPDVLEHSAASVKTLNNYNGFAVPPQKVGGVFTVLINKNVLMENVENRRMDWVGTIVHETTHVQDYAEYAKLVGAEEYEEILRISDHGMFNLWTEIHARANGYYFTRKYTVGEKNLQNEELIPDILNREIPIQWQRLYREYHSTSNGYEQAYLVAQYIGRLITLQRLYPDTFTDDWIAQHFEVNTWMTEWFLFYKKHATLEDATNHFEEMKVILGQNFQGI